MSNSETSRFSRLNGKVILVAGAGGIGSCLAHRYATEGAQVVLGDIDKAAAEQVASDIEASGGSAVAIHLDGADEQSASNAVSFCVQTFSGLDGLHANFASLADSNPELSILDLPLEVLDDVMRINARGHYLCTRAALPALLERGGAVVYTSSAAAYNSGPGQVAYAMSKSAGHALMRHVARRFGAQGVRANTIAPALTLHRKIEALLPTEMVDWAKAAAAIKSRIGRPEDIAAMSALLMSDEGSYITGQIINIDGGTIMRS